MKNDRIDRAQQTNLEIWLRSRGEKLIRSGSEWRWVTSDATGVHDSVTIRGSKWYDHKRGVGGDAISFAQTFYGLNFRDAITALTSGGEQNSSAKRTPSLSTVNCQFSITFTPPERAPNMHRTYAYLTQTRCLCPDVVTHFVRAGSLYEDAKHHNVIFLGLDEHGVPRAGYAKGTLTVGQGFRQTLSGSDTRYGFCHRGASDRLYVFEAAVDMLSYISMRQRDWQSHSYLALGGLSLKALRHFLSECSHIREVYLCLDHDPPGIEAAGRFQDELEAQGYAAAVTLPECKDWNETLKVRSGAEAIPAMPHPKIVAYQWVVKRLKSIDVSGLHRDTPSMIHSICRAVKQKDILRAALLSAAAAKTLGGGDVLRRLAEGYKPYADPRGQDDHLSAVRRHVLQLSLSPGAEAFANLADACIRAAIHSDAINSAGNPISASRSSPK